VNCVKKNLAVLRVMVGIAAVLAMHLKK